MADFGTPVATSINPVGQGVQTLSGLLSIKQQQQALQTGAYQQQETAARASQATQQNQELQALSQFTRSAIQDPSFRNPDGSLNVEKFQKGAAAAAPVYGQAYIGQATSNANAMLDNRKAMLGLSNEQRKTVGNYFNSVASNPQATREDFLEAAEQARTVSDDPAYQKSVDRMLMSAPDVRHLPTDQASQAIRRWASGIASETSGVGVTAPSTMETGAEIQPGVTNRYTGEFTPAGQAIKKPPEATPGPGGQILNRNPKTGALEVPPGSEVSATGNSAPSSKLPAMQRPGVNAPAADQANYNTRIQQLGQEYQAVSTAANDPMNGVQATRFRNQQILDLIPHAETGPGLRMLNTLASRLPGSSGDAYQDLEHYLSQNSAAMAKTMGVPSTNLGAETAAAAAGNVERNPGALREITRTNDALNTAMDLYNRGFAKVTNNGSDMSRAASYKQAFGQAVDINAIRWADAHRRGDREEIADLSKKLGPQGVKEVQQRLRVLKSLSENGDLP